MAPGVPVDCLITDVQMPGLGGLELATALQKHGLEIPVIFITAFPADRVRERAVTAGAIGFLAKPFDSQQLIDCIERVLRP